MHDCTFYSCSFGILKFIIFVNSNITVCKTSVNPIIRRERVQEKELVDGRAMLTQLFLGYITLHRFVSGLRFWLTEKRVKKNGRSLPAAIEKMTMRLSWTCFHGARYMVTIRQHPDVLHATSRTFNGFERHKIQTFSGGSLLYYLNFVSNRSTEKNSITPMKKRFFVVNIIVVYIALFFFK